MALYNLAGQVLLNKTIQLNSRTATESINMGTAIPPGLYKLEITDEAGKTDILRMTVQR